MRLRLEADGQVKLAAAAPPPADLLAALRLCRDDVVRLLAERRRPAWADISPEPPRRVYQPGDPDPLRDGLVAQHPPSPFDPLLTDGVAMTRFAALPVWKVMA